MKKISLIVFAYIVSIYSNNDLNNRPISYEKIKVPVAYEIYNSYLDSLNKKGITLQPFHLFNEFELSLLTFRINNSDNLLYDYVLLNSFFIIKDQYNDDKFNVSCNFVFAISEFFIGWFLSDYGLNNYVNFKCFSMVFSSINGRFMYRTKTESRICYSIGNSICPFIFRRNRWVQQNVSIGIEYEFNKISIGIPLFGSIDYANKNIKSRVGIGLNCFIVIQ